MTYLSYIQYFKDKLSHIYSKKNILLTPLLLLIGVLYTPVTGQPNLNTRGQRSTIQHFNRINTAGGMHNPYISVAESKRIVVANNEGLLIFDGASWELLQLPNGTQSRSVWAENDVVFCGGQRFFGLLRFENESSEPVWTDFTHLISETAGDFDDVWRIFGERRADGNSQVLFSCNRFVGTIDERGNFKLLHAGPIINTVETESGVVVQTDSELFEIDWSGNRLHTFPVPASNLRIEALIRPANSDQVLLLTHRSGVFQLRKDSWDFLATPLSMALRSYRVNCLIQRESEWLIGTSENGILTTSDFKEGKSLYNLSTGLAANTVLDLASDGFDNVWVGLEGGIDLLKYSWPHRIPLGTENIKDVGYSSLHVLNGSIYWGTSQSVYYQRKVDSTPEKISGISGPIWSLKECNQSAWVSHPNGAGILKKNQYIPIIQGTGVWNIWHLRDDIWVAGTYKGLRLILHRPNRSKTKEQWEDLGALTGFDESSRFLHVSDHDIWVTHPYKGAFKLGIDLEKYVVNAVRQYGAESGFPEPLQINLGAVNDEAMFATSRGFYRYDADRDCMIPDSSGLSEWIDENTNYERLYQDPTGELWLFQNREIRFIPIGQKSILEPVELGLAPMRQNAPFAPFESLEFLNDGSVCVPVEKGFIYLSPERMFTASDAPRVKISRIILLDGMDHPKELKPGGIELEAGVHAIEFKLSGLNSNWAGIQQYQWRISNVSSKWSEPSSSPRITLSALQPGAHTLEFRSSINGFYSGPIATESVTILPFWYQRMHYRLIMAFILGGGLFTFFRRNQRIIQAEHRLQQEEEKKKRILNELEFQASMKLKEDALIQQKSEAQTNLLASKNQELASATMNLVQKAQMIQSIASGLQQLKLYMPETGHEQINSLLQLIHDGGRLDDAWEQFTEQFDQVHVEFHQRITEQFPQLTKTDLKLCTYLRMNLSSKEIASLMFVTVRAVEVSRSRLRKRLELHKDQSLIQFIQNV